MSLTAATKLHTVRSLGFTTHTHTVDVRVKKRLLLENPAGRSQSKQQKDYILKRQKNPTIKQSLTQ